MNSEPIAPLSPAELGLSVTPWPEDDPSPTTSEHASDSPLPFDQKFSEMVAMLPAQLAEYWRAAQLNGALDIDGAEDDEWLSKALMSAALEYIADQWAPLGAQTSAVARNLRLYASSAVPGFEKSKIDFLVFLNVQGLMPKDIHYWDKMKSKIQADAVNAHGLNIHAFVGAYIFLNGMPTDFTLVSTKLDLDKAEEREQYFAAESNIRTIVEAYTR